MQHLGTAWWFGMALLLAGAIGSHVVVAQTPPGGHEQHHPPAPATESTSSPVTPATPASPASADAPAPLAPPKELYPSLMELPDLPAEKRADVQRAAAERMQSGTTLMLEGLEHLFQASQRDDYAVMQHAIMQLREGLARFDSGVAAQRALAEGRDARQLALQWFKDQMYLPAPPTPAAQPGLWGLSWSHLLLMLLLTIFAATMIVMYFFKMRRAAHLLQRLTSLPASAPPQAETAVPTPTPVSPALPSPPMEA